MGVNPPPRCTIMCLGGLIVGVGIQGFYIHILCIAVIGICGHEPSDIEACVDATSEGCLGSLLLAFGFVFQIHLPGFFL